MIIAVLIVLYSINAINTGDEIMNTFDLIKSCRMSESIMAVDYLAGKIIGFEII